MNRERIARLILFGDDTPDVSTGYIGVGSDNKRKPTVMEVLEMIRDRLNEQNYEFRWRFSNEASYDITGGIKDYWCPKGLEHAPCWIRCGVKRKAMSKWQTKNTVFQYGDTDDIRPDDTIISYYDRNKYDGESLLEDMKGLWTTGNRHEEFMLGRVAQEIYNEYFGEEDEQG